MSERPVVGVLAPDDDVAPDVEAAVEAAGGRAMRGPADAADSDSLVAVGEAALLTAVRERPACPVLPVAAGRGFRSVPRERLEAAVESLVAGEYATERHPVVAVQVADTTRVTVGMDVMLVTSEPAEISEYAVRSDGERVAQFRADGVVVATPGGSAGYARAAGGPVVSPDTGAGVVVPIAPFATDTDHWVVGLDGLVLSVERDAAAVSLLADDREVGLVSTSDPVRLAVDTHVEVAVVAGSSSRFRP